MPLQNRVTLFGDIVANPARGTLMGNRGRLHDAERRLGTARWRARAWVTCHLRFRGRHRQVMAPGRYTELFFLDEATALAAGHRPCGECRRADYKRFLDCFRRGNRLPQAPLRELDALLHADRVDRTTRRQRRYRANLDALPDGTAILAPWDSASGCVVWGDRLLPWSLSGYGAARPRPAGIEVTVLTPRATVAALAAGYRPALYPARPASG